MISIIIPAYGEQLFLKKCISSIYNSINGSKFEHEIIIVSDHGHLRSHQQKLNNFSKVKYVVSNDKLSPARARNLGSAKARGSWLFFLDSDCELNPAYIKRLQKHLEHYNDVDGILGEIVASDQESIPLDEDYDYRSSLQKYFYHRNGSTYSKIVSGANFLLKRDIFIEVGKFDERWSGSEDRELGARLFLRGYKIVYKDNLIVYHHYYPDLKHTIKRHIWHAQWNSRLYLMYPTIFRKPFLTRGIFTLNYLQKIIIELGYFLGVVTVYDIVFTKEYLWRRIQKWKAKTS